MTVFIAALETRHFSFDVVADTALHARATLLKALMIHGKQLKLRANWYEDLIVDISVREMMMGQAYRDRTVI